MPRRRSDTIYPDYDTKGPAQDHLGIFYGGGERNIFVKDVQSPVQVKKPRFTFK